MPGSADSKYGIIGEQVPIKKIKPKPRKKLKNLRQILKKKREMKSNE